MAVEGDGVEAAIGLEPGAAKGEATRPLAVEAARGAAVAEPAEAAAFDAVDTPLAGEWPSVRAREHSRAVAAPGPPLAVIPVCAI